MTFPCLVYFFPVAPSCQQHWQVLMASTAKQAVLVAPQSEPLYCGWDTTRRTVEWLLSFEFCHSFLISISNIYLLIFSFTFLATLTSADVVFGKASKESGTAKPTVMPSMGHPNNKVVCLIGYLFSSRLTSPVFCMCDLLHDECSCAGKVSGVFPSYMVKHAYYFDWLALYIYCIHLKDDGMI